MTEQSIDNKTEDVEIDMLAILRKVIAIRKKLYKAIIIGAVIGIIVGLSLPKKYTVNVTLSPEMGSDKGSNGMSGLAASFLSGSAGMNGNLDALNASLSSDIVSSTPFLLELLNMQVEDKGNTLSDYIKTQSSPWWNYIIGLPSTIITGIKSLFLNEEDSSSQKTQGGVIVLTKKENAQISVLMKNITAIIDKKTAITSINVTLQDPKIAAVVADSVVHLLQNYIITYRTSKAKEDCTYLEKLFEERKQEYYAAQRKYAEYVDTHDNLILQRVRTEQERLQNDMSLAYQVYSQVANQLQVARAKVQEEKPIFAVIEPAVVPLRSSNVGVFLCVCLFAFLTVSCVMTWQLFIKEMLNRLKSEIG